MSRRRLGHEADKDPEHGGCTQNVEVHSVGPGGGSGIAGGSEADLADIGVGPTDLLADGVMDPNLT